MKAIVKIGAALALILGMAQTVSADEVTEAIAERTAPASTICMQGEPCAAAPVAAAPKGPRTGKEVYTASCQACHAVGVSGAPKMGNAGDWGPRIDKGLETLYKHAIGGFNAMPAKGLCMDCSEDEIKSTVDYMVEGSK